MHLSSAFGHHRHGLADVRAGDLGLDRLELAANVRGRVGLGVPDVDVARAALQEDQDHRFRAAEAARAFELRVGACAVFCHAKKLREVQADRFRGADAQQLAAGGAFTGVALHGRE